MFLSMIASNAIGLASLHTFVLHSGCVRVYLEVLPSLSSTIAISAVLYLEYPIKETW